MQIKTGYPNLYHGSDYLGVFVMNYYIHITLMSLITAYHAMLHVAIDHSTCRTLLNENRDRLSFVQQVLTA